ncbi:MAG: glycosyltransferase family 4 protein [Nitrospinae bacterium]|nr:glycosyltransferase family 4 protein [Nitrospinota bacterium]
MERKGLIYIIRSLSLLKKENISLIVIGRGIDENYFKREAEKNGVGDLIRFAGQREDIHKFYASADIFVLPAIYEPFGMAIAEAMASGLPVVVSRQTGISEIISDGEDGILLDRPDAPEEIAHRLLPLIRDSEMRLKIGQRARKKAESLSWDLIAEETMRVYINLKNKNLI